MTKPIKSETTFGNQEMIKTIFLRVQQILSTENYLKQEKLFLEYCS